MMKTYVGEAPVSLEMELHNDHALPDKDSDHNYKAPYNDMFTPCTCTEAPFGIRREAEAFVHGPEQRHPTQSQRISRNMHYSAEQNPEKDQVRGTHQSCWNGLAAL